VITPYLIADFSGFRELSSPMRLALYVLSPGRVGNPLDATGRAVSVTITDQSEHAAKMRLVSFSGPPVFFFSSSRTTSSSCCDRTSRSSEPPKGWLDESKRSRRTHSSVFGGRFSFSENCNRNARTQTSKGEGNGSSTKPEAQSARKG
jgi:hypothetical protein